MSDPTQYNLQLWGGVECTVNRVHGRYFEQLNRLGHKSRITDLDLFAELGFSCLRQPVLWEEVAPNGLARADWSWTDRWLARERDLDLQPIIGLVHHGSGPTSTSLLDPEFPVKLAAYAGEVARRYPWVTDFTPVNEPLTTARFSGLYGHWYPHARNDHDFLIALLVQCRAVILAMRAIRKVTPDARLIQTEDLGKTFSTPGLRHQAEFENERRWLSLDLLCGRVDKHHPLWGYIVHHVDENSVSWFADNPLPPDVMGFNYYLSSERYLDEELGRYPQHLHGGNGRDRYVDVELPRVRLESLAGAKLLLKEAYDRFGLPMAITECHNGCTREEQLRWFSEVWKDCASLRGAGVDVRAVTAWSLLGAFDWNSLVTCHNDCYEPGVFDVRGPRPRPTILASVAKQLARGDTPDHPLLDVPGWWRRPSRFVFGHAISDSGRRIPGGTLPVPEYQARPVLITGGTGTLGQEFARACDARGIAHRLTFRSELDIADHASVARAVLRYRPWAIINTAGYVRVDDAEMNLAQCFRENAVGAAVLALECAKNGLELVTFSSDLVFDGSKGSPYVETDVPNPLNVYGLSKLAAELDVWRNNERSLIIRTSAFFGPADEFNFVSAALRKLMAGRRFRAAADAFISPTYVPDLVNHTLDLLIDKESGIWHLANVGSVSWYELARQAAEMAGVPTETLVECSSAAMELPAPRPDYSVLTSEKVWIMPSLENALMRYTEARRYWQTLEVEAA